MKNHFAFLTLCCSFIFMLLDGFCYQRSSTNTGGIFYKTRINSVNYLISASSDELTRESRWSSETLKDPPLLLEDAIRCIQEDLAIYWKDTVEFRLIKAELKRYMDTDAWYYDINGIVQETEAADIGFSTGKGDGKEPTDVRFIVLLSGRVIHGTEVVE